MNGSLTNESAIKIINKKFSGKSKSEATAIIFASEDIIQMDIDNWMNTSLNELYDSFIHNSVEGARILIDREIRERKYVNEKALAYGAVDKMASAMKSMGVYADIYQTLKKESER